MSVRDWRINLECLPYAQIFPFEKYLITFYINLLSELYSLEFLRYYLEIRMDSPLLVSEGGRQWRSAISTYDKYIIGLPRSISKDE